MMTLEYYRFVLEPETKHEVIGDTRKLNKMFYHEEFDHRIREGDDQCPLEKAKQLAKSWEKDHYGFVDIYHDGGKGMEYHIRLSNRSKFWKKFLEDNILVVKRG